ncbi:hypothetical protein [Formosa sp. L2A11]|uniref:hypothetical protein n=1 Tax=Formosa sp. L2A11 TaxID=2686363 RepID=UPI00131C1E09|nr:hypothetical protein [Formosa sp. L2A11]
MYNSKNLIIPILILLISCSKNTSESKKTNQENTTEWVLYNTKDSIPRLMMLTLKQALKNDFSIANPNEEFNRTDVIINDTIPRKQLRLLSRKGNFWRMTYIQGGIGLHYVYTECKIIKDTISDFKISQTNLKIENNDTIDFYLYKKRLKLNDVKIIMK